ncbi:MAG: outer membrane protein assembly factor BamB [Pseudomonadota bacterium]|jgi:outer membrane protein assembly factor BamB
MRRLLLAAALLLLVASCSKEKEVNPPAELTDFDAVLRVDRVWSAGVGSDGEALRLGLALAVEGERVYAAGRGGEVAAFELKNGRAIWRTRTRARLGGGPGANPELVVVGSSDGEVIALEASNGSIRWRVNVGGEVLAPPAVADRAVVVRTVDGRLVALAPSDGRELWSYSQPVPRLSLRGTARPVIAGDLVLCGFDNGKVAAVELADGDLVWETIIAPPRGRTELERLVDIDSAVHVYDNDVFAVGFQGRSALLALDSGQIWWAQEMSSHRGLGLDDSAVYVSTSGGEVVALNRRTGTELWRQDALLNRGLTAPAATDHGVAVADFQGYVHWLDKETGELAARASSGGARVTNPPVVAGDLLLVINDAGRITAFRTRPRGDAGVAASRSGRSAAETASE